MLKWGSAPMDNSPFIIELPEALVTKELWLAAQTYGNQKRASDTRSFLFQDLVPCPECDKALNFPTHTAGAGKMTCSEGHGTTYSTVAIEQIVLGLIADHLVEAASDEFRRERVSELDKANAENLAIRADLEAKIADLEKRILSAYRNSLHLDPQSVKYATVVVDEYRAEKDQFEKRLAVMPKSLGLLVKGEAAAAGLRNELSFISEHSPFRANTPDDEEMMERIRDLVSEVKLIPVADGKFDVRVTLRTIAQSLDKAVVRQARSQVLTTREVNQVDRFEAFGERIESFKGRLTDQEWETMPEFRGCDLKVPDARDTIDAALIWSELDIPPWSVMRHWGHEHPRCNGPGLLLNRRDEILIKHLRKTRGQEFDMRIANPTPRGSENERLRYVRHPLLLLPICQPGSEVTDLDDAQWAAVADVLNHLRHHKLGFHSARRALTSYFNLARSEYGRNQIWLVGGNERHHRYVQVLFDMGLMDQVTRALLALEGFVIPDDYEMPTPARGQLRTKTSIPETDDVVRHLSGLFGRQAAPERKPRVTRKLRLGTVIVDTELLSAWTSDGDVVPLTMRLLKALIFLMERPDEVVSGDDIHRGSRGIGPEVERDFTREGTQVINDVRRVLKKHCKVAWKSIKTLSNWRSTGHYTLTVKPVVIEADTQRAPIAFLPDPDRPKLVAAIVKVLKETAQSEAGLEALEFLLNGATKQVQQRGSLAYRMLFIKRKLQQFFPTNKDPTERLASVTRRYNGSGVYVDTTYTLRALGRLVRKALIEDGTLSDRTTVH